MIHIRKGTKEDIPELNKIDSFASQLNTYSGLNKIDPKYKQKKEEKSYYETFISGKKKWCLVAEKEKKIIGFVLFNIQEQEEFYQIKKVGYIDLLFVNKKERKKGVSKQLLAQTQTILKTEGINYCKLSVHTDNPAKQAWEKSGFKEYRVHMWKEI